MVSQVSLDCSPQENVSQDCMFRLGPTNLGNKDEDFSVLSCSQEHTNPQMPVKKTRQWAAWTRQEEESFFAALRQVGKNFERITCRVQSKNKDQVRHYYYRLVRRMNKLLGPELCLDAKNSKDTNAAMLRWWSLLEKYSCKASKLHLKPRRFKIFVETLENQLLRDRKKSIKRRVSTGQNNSSILSIPASYQIRAPRPEINAVKAVLVDGQNIKKVGNGALFKRPVNIGTGRANYKIDPSTVRTSNHRRRTAAYKRWERAAIAGVSLVADAAEHLERVDTDKEIDNVPETSGPAGSQLADKVAHSLQSPPYSLLTENCIQNSAKLKLQLFPVDECTRRVLEMDNHNPHLELTLSTKKKISSVIEHLNRKWQNSSSQSQELLLFPFLAQGENLMGYQKWTMDSPLCAADVYYLIGSPPIFRLRYGWFSRDKVESVAPRASSSTISEKKLSISRTMGQNAKTANASDSCNNPLVSSESISPTPSSSSTPNKRIECGLPVSELNTLEYHDGAVVASPAMKENGDVSSKGQAGNKSVVLSAGQWADSLTNVSIGDLISESEAAMDMDCSEFPTPLIPNGLHHMPFTCDSFDAAIAAHIRKYQNRAGAQQGLVSRISSIWDAEETCDAFSFQGVSPFNVKDHSSSMAHNLEEVPEVATVTSSDCPCVDLANASSPDHPLKPDRSTKDHGGPTDSDCPYEDRANDSSPDDPPDHSMRDLGGLTDIYWPDSLGLLDLGVPSCRYSCTDLILTDSLNAMNRLVATSLDAFQSCSFFGLEKKESASTSEACQTFSFSDFKI